MTVSIPPPPQKKQEHREGRKDVLFARSIERHDIAAYFYSLLFKAYDSSVIFRLFDVLLATFVKFALEGDFAQ